MVKRTQLLGVISSFHLILGVFSMVLGIVAIKVSPYLHGVFGMGIWLGGWMLITGVTGLLTANSPTNLCRLGGFTGCCLVGIVFMFVSSIILGVGVLEHFKFEASLTREYYRSKGLGYERDYKRPQEYFDERNRNGKNGIGIYGALLAVIVTDMVVSLVACCLNKEIIKKTQANTQPRRPSRPSSRQERSPAARSMAPSIQPYADSSQLFQLGYIQNGFPVTSKLPSYGELYPERISHPEALQVILEPVPMNAAPTPQPALQVPTDTPPAYTP